MDRDSLDRTYVIPDGADLLELRISRVGTLIHLHHNGGTKSFDVPGAESLRNALMAVLSGTFDHAETETSIRLRTEREARRPAAPQPLPPTGLDML